MKRQESLTGTKVAWLIPSMARNFFHWLPLIEEFSNIFPDTIVFTGLCPENISSENVSFNLKIAGKTRFIKLGTKGSRYEKVIIIPPLDIPFHLLKFLPQVILTYGFSIWTVIVLLLKPFIGWRVIVVYEGSTPTVDDRESKLRTFGRKLMTRGSDAFLTNTHSGKSYLVEFLKANKELVFVRPYLLPDIKYLTLKEVDVKKLLVDAPRPVFLYVGLIIQRKGLKFLIEAFAALKSQGYDNYTLLIVGDGPQRGELEDIVKEREIEKQVRWMGWFDYNSLGYFYSSSDIFVFPTYEDTWGLVVLEAMAFAKPVLCSKLAGAQEMIQEGENGYIFNPDCDSPDALAEIIKRFIDNPNIIEPMGQKSKTLASSHTPRAIADYLKCIIEFVLGLRNRSSIKFAEYPQKQQ